MRQTAGPGACGSTLCRYWYVLNGHGDVVALTDPTGNVVDRYHYDSWGVPSIDLETVTQPLLYAGYFYDRELSAPNESTGWYWLSTREYDPALRRFLQPDPSGIEGARSYVYAGDDPVDEADPSGLINGCAIPVWSWLTCRKGPTQSDWNNFISSKLYVSGAIIYITTTAKAPEKVTGGTQGDKAQWGEEQQDIAMRKFGYDRIGGHPPSNPSENGLVSLRRKVCRKCVKVYATNCSSMNRRVAWSNLSKARRRAVSVGGLPGRIWAKPGVSTRAQTRLKKAAIRRPAGVGR